MEWMVRFEALTQSQLQVIRTIEGSRRPRFWIKGFAGSGKTLILMHLAKRYLRLHPQHSCCFLTFTNALTQLIRTGFTPDEAQKIRVSTIHSFKKEPTQADLIVLDEVQDCMVSDLALICKNAGLLIAAGDADQRIYDNRASQEEIRELLGNPETFELTEIHRLTQKIARVAKVILPGSHILAGSIEDVALKRGADVRLFKYPDTVTETEAVFERALDSARAGEPAVIFLPKHYLIDEFATALAELKGLPQPPGHPCGYSDPSGEVFNRFMEEHDIPLAYYGNGFGSMSSSDEKPFVYLMTYHSSKGLDFDHVFLPYLDQDAPLDDDEKNRSLLFVALTRSRFDLELSFSSEAPAALIKAIADSDLLAVQDAPKSQNDAAAQTDNDDDDFFF